MLSRNERTSATSPRENEVRTIHGASVRMNSDVAAPYTAIVIGSGCSVNLDVPTMYNFMDTVIEKLSKSTKKPDKNALKDIKG